MSDMTDEQWLLNEFVKSNLDVPDTDKLETVSALAERQLVLEQEINALDEQMCKLSAQLNEVSGKLLPDALAAAGLSEIKLKTGAKLTVKPWYTAKIPAGREHDAFTWLENNGHGGIIKHVISTEFNRGEHNEANAVKAVLEREGIQFSDKESVNPMTLKAFIREQVESGAPVPLDTFGATVGQRTYIKKGE
jgi:hypothetical protein